MIEKDITYLAPAFSGYTELRMQQNTSYGIGFINGNLMGNRFSVTSGVSARVYKNGVWGFASHPELTKDASGTAVKEALANAQFLDAREKRGKPPLPSTYAKCEKDFSTKKKRLNQSAYIDFVKEIDTYIQKTYLNIISRTVSLQTLDMEKSLVTSDGTVSYSLTPRTIFFVSLSADKDKMPVELYEVFGGLGQFEDIFEAPENLYEKIEKLYANLMKKCDGVYAQAGEKECVLDSNLAGILAHEAIGHTTEADLVLGGSVALDYLNKEAASPLITLIDFAHTALGKTCPVPVYIDDEGTEARDIPLIDKGILKNFLHNKETALHFNMAPTGNARASGFYDEPLIRMRNTAIVPGRDKLTDMIESIDDGYYLINSSNGQADSTGEFMFGVPLGFEIKKGKIGKAIFDTTISGIAFNMLKTVTMVSDEMTWSEGGFCGKKQVIPVGMGGPAVKCRVTIGGK
jgi:TldD protein